MDLAAASFVILAEELGHSRILSTDQRGFKVGRWKKSHTLSKPFITGIAMLPPLKLTAMKERVYAS